jgi:hypothetical protein
MRKFFQIGFSLRLCASAVKMIGFSGNWLTQLFPLADSRIRSALKPRGNMAKCAIATN